MINPVAVQQFLTLFFSGLLLAFPWLLLGITLSSAFLIWTDEQQWVANFPRNRLLSTLVGSLLGFLLPVGQLGSIPVTRRLLLQGAPIPLAISFFIAAPTLNFLTLGITILRLDFQPRLIFLRVALTWLMAIVIGLVFSVYRVPRWENPAEQTVPLAKIPLLRSGVLVPVTTKDQPRQGGLVFGSGVNPISGYSLARKLQLFGRNIIEELQEFGSVLILGTVIAAALDFWLVPEGLLRWAGYAPTEQLSVMLLMGLLLPLGAFSNLGVVTPLTEQVWLGGLLGFLLLGSLLNLQSLALWLTTFRLHPLIYLIVLIGLLVTLFSGVTNFYLT